MKADSTLFYGIFQPMTEQVVVQGPRHFCLIQDPLYKVFAPEFPRGLVNSEVKLLVAQLCPTPCDPKDCSPPGSSVHGVLQARILKWWQFPSQGDLDPGIRDCQICVAVSRSLLPFPSHWYDVTIHLLYSQPCLSIELAHLVSEWSQDHGQ